MPLLLVAGLALLAALWAGLARLGWHLPAMPAAWPVQHGPLMISGFLGTLISLERALALSSARPHETRFRLAYMAPALAALSAAATLLGLAPWLSRGLAVLAAVGLAAIFAAILRLQRTDAHVVMALGAVLWVVGNALWLAGLPVARLVPWWAGFLIVTIAGERLELGRVRWLGTSQLRAFYAVVAVFVAGLLLSLAASSAGVRLAGAGLLLLGLWLLRYDVAGRTIRMAGLTRFMAACLLPGYGWLAFGGGLWLALGGGYAAGPYYDALLHSLLVGFVLSMIFGHAPIILPAVTGLPLLYRPTFYLHLGLLHASLVLRVAGDLAVLHTWRQWGGLLNVTAVVVFLANTVWAAARSAPETRE
jgi:hypothetical protein